MRILKYLLTAMSVLAVSSALQAKSFPDSECQECHGERGFSVPLGQHGASGKKELFVDSAFFKDSVHGNHQCTDCHTDIEEVPHRKDGLGVVDCISCHEQLADKNPVARKRRSSLLGGQPPRRIVAFTSDYKLSTHANRGIENNATCASCHTAHYVYPSEDKRANTYRLKSPGVCGACHEKALAEYRQSMHGATLKTPWKGDSATCSDCHTSHQINAIAKLPAHRIITQGCGNCHQSEPIWPARTVSLPGMAARTHPDVWIVTTVTK